MITETDIKNFMNSLQIQFEQEKKMQEVIRKIDEEKKRHEEYRASLKPISKDDLINKIIEIQHRYKQWIKNAEKAGILYTSLRFDFNDINEKFKNAKNEIDYAEIADKLEGTMHDFEIMFDIIKEVDIDFDTLKAQRDKKRKEFSANKKSAIEIKSLKQQNER